MRTNVSELHSFLGFVNFYGDFIDEQNALIASLYDLTAARKRTKPLHFSAEHAQNYNKINAACALPPSSLIRTSRRRSRFT